MAAESIGGIQVDIVGDYSKLQEDLQSAQTIAAQGAEQIAATFTTAAGNADTLTAAVGAVSGTVQALAESATQATGALDPFDAAVARAVENGSTLTEAISSATAALAPMSDSLGYAGGAAGTAAEQLAELKAASDNGAASAQEVARAEAEVQKAFEAANPSVHEASGGIAELGKELLALGGIALTIEALKEFTVGCIEAAAEDEKFIISMTALRGSAELATASLEGIDAAAIRLALPKDELMRAEQRMTAFGFSADAVTAALDHAADSAAATGTGFDSVATRMANMAESGNAMGRALVALGINTEDLGKIMGVSAEEASKAFKEYDKSDRLEILGSAMEKFGGTAEAVAKSTSGEWQNLKTQLEFVMEDIGKAINPAVKDIIPGLGEALKGIVAAGTMVVTGLNLVIDAIVGLVSVGGAAITGMVNVWAHAATGDFKGAVTSMSDAITAVKAASTFAWESMIKDATSGGELIKKVYGDGAKAADSSSESTKKFAGAIKDTGESVDAVSPKFRTLNSASKDFVDTVEQYPDAAQQAMAAAEAHTAKLSLLSEAVVATNRNLERAKENYDGGTGSLAELSKAQDLATAALNNYNKAAAALPIDGTFTPAMIQNTKDMAAGVTSILGPLSMLPPGMFDAQTAARNLGLEFGKTSQNIQDAISDAHTFSSDSGADVNDVVAAWGKASGAVQQLAKTDLPAAIKAQRDYIDDLEKTPKSYQAAQRAQEDLLGMEVQWAHQSGKDASDYLISLDKLRQKLNGSGSDTLYQAYKDIQKITSDVFADVRKAVADSIVDSKNFSDAMVNAGKAIAKEFIDDLLKLALQPVEKALTNLIGSLFPSAMQGASGAAGAIGGLGGAASTATSSVSSLGGATSSASGAAISAASGLSGFMGTLTGVSSAVSAVTGVIGLFQGAAQLATQKLIEYNTRVTAIETQYARADQWDQFTKELQKWDDIWATIREGNDNIFTRLGDIWNQIQESQQRLDAMVELLGGGIIYGSAPGPGSSTVAPLPAAAPQGQPYAPSQAPLIDAILQIPTAVTAASHDMTQHLTSAGQGSANSMSSAIREQIALLQTQEEVLNVAITNAVHSGNTEQAQRLGQQKELLDAQLTALHQQLSGLDSIDQSTRALPPALRGVESGIVSSVTVSRDAVVGAQREIAGHIDAVSAATNDRMEMVRDQIFLLRGEEDSLQKKIADAVANGDNATADLLRQQKTVLDQHIMSLNAQLLQLGTLTDSTNALPPVIRGMGDGIVASISDNRDAVVNEQRRTATYIDAVTTTSTANRDQIVGAQREMAGHIDDVTSSGAVNRDLIIGSQHEMADRITGGANLQDTHTAIQSADRNAAAHTVEVTNALRETTSATQDAIGAAGRDTAERISTSVGPLLGRIPVAIDDSRTGITTAMHGEADRIAHGLDNNRDTITDAVHGMVGHIDSLRTDTRTAIDNASHEVAGHIDNLSIQTHTDVTAGTHSMVGHIDALGPTIAEAIGNARDRIVTTYEHWSRGVIAAVESLQSVLIDARGAMVGHLGVVAKGVSDSADQVSDHVDTGTGNNCDQITTGTENIADQIDLGTTTLTSTVAGAGAATIGAIQQSAAAQAQTLAQAMSALGPNGFDTSKIKPGSFLDSLLGPGGGAPTDFSAQLSKQLGYQVFGNLMQTALPDFLKAAMDQAKALGYSVPYNVSAGPGGGTAVNYANPNGTMGWTYPDNPMAANPVALAAATANATVDAIAKQLADLQKQSASNPVLLAAQKELDSLKADAANVRAGFEAKIAELMKQQVVNADAIAVAIAGANSPAIAALKAAQADIAAQINDLTNQKMAAAPGTAQDEVEARIKELIAQQAVNADNLKAMQMAAAGPVVDKLTAANADIATQVSDLKKQEMASAAQANDAAQAAQHKVDLLTGETKNVAAQIIILKDQLLQAQADAAKANAAAAANGFVMPPQAVWDAFLKSTGADQLVQQNKAIYEAIVAAAAAMAKIAGPGVTPQLPSFDSGGYVAHDMTAMMHAGDWVIPPSGHTISLPPDVIARIGNLPSVPAGSSASGFAQSRGGDVITITVPVTIIGAQNPEADAKALLALMRTHSRKAMFS